MNKREKIIGVVMLVIIMLSALMYSPSEKKDKSKKKRTPVTKSTVRKTNQAEEQKEQPAQTFDLVKIGERIKLRSKVENISSKRDPFEKLEPKFAPLSFKDLILTGISFEDEEPVAVINKQILKVGDVFSGFELIEIREIEVVLNKGIGRYILKFSAEKKIKNKREGYR